MKLLISRSLLGAFSAWSQVHVFIHAGLGSIRYAYQLIRYRETEFISGLRKAYAFNERKPDKLSPSRFVQVSIPLGRMKLEVNRDYFLQSWPLWLSVQAGQTYSVKAAVAIDFLSNRMVMGPVDP